MLWTVILNVKEIDSLLRKSVNYIFKHHSCYRAVYQTFHRLKCFIGWKKVKNGTNLIPLCVDFSATKNKFKYHQYTMPPYSLCGFYIIDIRETTFVWFFQTDRWRAWKGRKIQPLFMQVRMTWRVELIPYCIFYKFGVWVMVVHINFILLALLRFGWCTFTVRVNWKCWKIWKSKGKE